MRASTAAGGHVSRWIIYLARAGYTARGVVYVLIGGLALLSALGHGGETTDSKGALESLMQSPGGWAVLIVVGVGLVGHALWRFVQAVLDPDGLGKDLKGVVTRAGMAISGLTHLALAVSAISLGVGHASDEGNARASWTAWLMGQPFGRWMVAAVGVAIIGAGVAQFIKSYKEKFKERLDTSESLVHKLTPICRFGLAARGVVLFIIGSFFVYAGWTYDPGQAGGLEQTFDTVRGIRFGQILLAIVASGMLAFAVYSFVEARYRRIRSPV
jgi:hypothetical protein